jgi:deoxyribodipyrimidine photo-lyase
MIKPVIYWTSRALRVKDNPALSLAQHLAIQQRRPLKVVFVVYPHFPNANVRNMHFLLEGLKEMQVKLQKLNIPLECVLSDPVAYFMANLDTIGELVMDHHVLKPVIQVQKQVLKLCQDLNVKTHVVSVATVVPVEVASPKLEFAAKTFRPKIMKIYKDWLNEVGAIEFHPFNNDQKFDNNIDVEAIIKSHPHWKSLPLSHLIPGEDAAIAQLNSFIENDLVRYDQRNEVSARAQSYLSAYLHFGMISPKLMIRSVEA